MGKDSREKSLAGDDAGRTGHGACGAEREEREGGTDTSAERAKPSNRGAGKTASLQRSTLPRPVPHEPGGQIKRPWTD